MSASVTGRRPDTPLASVGAWSAGTSATMSRSAPSLSMPSLGSGRSSTSGRSSLTVQSWRAAPGVPVPTATLRTDIVSRSVLRKNALMRAATTPASASLRRRARPARHATSSFSSAADIGPSNPWWCAAPHARRDGVVSARTSFCASAAWPAVASGTVEDSLLAGSPAHPGRCRRGLTSQAPAERFCLRENGIASRRVHSALCCCSETAPSPGCACSPVADDFEKRCGR